MKINKYIIIIIILFVGIVALEYNAPKPINWNASFKSNDKIPFGSFVLHNLLNEIFPKSKIATNSKSIYLTLRELSEEYNESSYMIVTDNFSPQKVSLESMLDYVDKGNKVFISAASFGSEFSDTLDFVSSFYFSSFGKKDSLPYNFKNKHLETDTTYWIKSSYYNFHFDSANYKNSKAIAAIDNDKINYLRIPFGDGEFFIHNQPYAFTNYNMLISKNAEYVYKALSYIDSETIVWDENFKPGREEASSPLKYILSSESLSKSYYVIIFLAFVFLIFSSKRMQRIIPIIRKPENSSLEFAKTLGNLYMSGKNHKDIALKKYQYWIDFLREKYYIAIEAGETPNIKKISEKTGVKIELIKKILESKSFIAKSTSISSEQLLSFNRTIEKFHAIRK